MDEDEEEVGTDCNIDVRADDADVVRWEEEETSEAERSDWFDLLCIVDERDDDGTWEARGENIGTSEEEVDDCMDCAFINNAHDIDDDEDVDAEKEEEKEEDVRDGKGERNA